MNLWCPLNPALNITYNCYGYVFKYFKYFIMIRILHDTPYGDDNDCDVKDVFDDGILDALLLEFGYRVPSGDRYTQKVPGIVFVLPLSMRRVRGYFYYCCSKCCRRSPATKYHLVEFHAIELF